MDSEVPSVPKVAEVVVELSLVAKTFISTMMSTIVRIISKAVYISSFSCIT